MRYCLTLAFLALLALPAHAARMQTTDELAASFTVIPPTVATTTSLVDIRLALHNKTSVPMTALVQFYVDILHDSMRIMTEERRIEIPPGQQEVIQATWAPVAFTGKRLLLATIAYRWIEGTTLTANWTSLEWPLQVLGVTSGQGSAPYFTAAWLEPGALGFFPWAEITADDIRALVRSYKARGISLLILAYPEMGGCLYYPSEYNTDWHPTRPNIVWLDHSACRFRSDTYWYECATDPSMVIPSRDRCPWVRTYDFIETLLAEADTQGMHVMLGLGRSGDSMFSLALEDYYLLAIDGIPNKIDPALLNMRLGRIQYVSTNLARELWQKYKHHPSLYGWAISHELTCYDVSRNLYDPVASIIKQHTMPDRPVLVAPYSPRNCSPGTAPIPQQIRESTVDIYMYQDAVGSSAWNDTVQPRIAELPTEYADIARWHVGTGKHLWASIEVWRAAWNWDQRESPSGIWSTEVLPQMQAASRAASTLVLNEGLFYLEHGIPRLQIPYAAKRISAQKLTEAYKTYVVPLLKQKP